MKFIRPTKSKTRIGILNWLAKLNPLFTQQQKMHIYNEEWIIAVHVDKHTGAIVAWETRFGNLIDSDTLLIMAA